MSTSKNNPEDGGPLRQTCTPQYGESPEIHNYFVFTFLTLLQLETPPVPSV